MPIERDELREELLAILAANRELPREVDEQLVDGLLAKIHAENPVRQRLRELAAVYHALVPVKAPMIAAIAVAQGFVLLALGDYVIKHIISAYGLYPYPGVFVPAWGMLALLWVVEVLATVAVVSAFTPRPERRSRKAKRRALNV